jgi:hypothetical protein
VIRRQIEPQSAKSFDQAGIVAVEEIGKADSMGIRIPFQQQVEQIPSPGAKGKVERAVDF